MINKVIFLLGEGLVAIKESLSALIYKQIQQSKEDKSAEAAGAFKSGKGLIGLILLNVEGVSDI